MISRPYPVPGLGHRALEQGDVFGHLALSTPGAWSVCLTTDSTSGGIGGVGC